MGISCDIRTGQVHTFQHYVQALTACPNLPICYCDSSDKQSKKNAERSGNTLGVNTAVLVCASKISPKVVEERGGRQTSPLHPPHTWPVSVYDLIHSLNTRACAVTRTQEVKDSNLAAQKRPRIKQ